ncbi:hypothetical protein [Inhella gelatinilytica]|uniref:MSHA biogenesis protein MshK n=1 Tax=Inhella gelatinilytica TaxID=2795030 RepID=A0A931ISI3_9BURK|nr:hypothetical protein [Inhella gelatinilytica]MBH9551334.1 hypothetical protein [Inhella gelatinilytica]
MRALWGIVGGLSAVASVQALPDPTLPPPQARASVSAGLPASPVSAAPARPVLQGLRPGQQPTAVVSGQLLRPGQSVQGHVLLRIEADAVVMRDPEGQRLRLTMWPVDEKKPLIKEVRR